MLVRNPKKKEVELGSLMLGKCFSIDGVIYLKINAPQRNAVNLVDGVTYGLLDKTRVIPLKVVANIED